MSVSISKLHASVLKPVNEETHLRGMTEEVRNRATEEEVQARIEQILQWMAEGIKGRKLSLLVMEEYSVESTRSYDYIKMARDLQTSMILMSPVELRKLCRKIFLNHVHSSDKKISIMATKELAKHANFYPATQVDVTARYDSLPKEDLEQLALENGVE